MKKQNFILKYKLATYKAMMIIVIMILLFSHSTSVIKPSHAMRTSLVYQVGEKPVNDLANHCLMNLNKNMEAISLIITVILLFISMIFYCIIVGGNINKSEYERKRDDYEQMNYLKEFERIKRNRKRVIRNGKNLYR